jgi:hypothetical protein
MNMPLEPTWPDIAIRLGLTMLACGAIGLNRGARGWLPNHDPCGARRLGPGAMLRDRNRNRMLLSIFDPEISGSASDGARNYHHQFINIDLSLDDELLGVIDLE